MDVDGGRPFLELEYVRGRRLSTLVRRHGSLRATDAVSLGRDLAAALAYLHTEGLVHLDVKPSNVIAGSLPGLIDLSVARRIDRARLINGFVGTDAYMAPEQCDPARWGEIGTASDIWGLGVTVHEAMTGRLPYARPSSERRYPQLDWVPRELDDLPPALEPLVRSCLAPRPEERPSAGELGDALEPLVDALPAPRIGRLRPGGKRMLEALEGR